MNSPLLVPPILLAVLQIRSVALTSTVVWMMTLSYVEMMAVTSALPSPPYPRPEDRSAPPIRNTHLVVLGAARRDSNVVISSLLANSRENQPTLLHS